MQAIVLVATLVAASAHADTFKLGEKQHIKHGCATSHAKAALDEFLGKDPTFTFSNGKVTLTETMPTADKKGEHQHTWPGTLIGKYSAHWDMPPTDVGQVRILIDLDPSLWCDNAPCTKRSTKIRVSIIQDYDPEHYGTHENVCAESWFGQAVQL